MNLLEFAYETGTNKTTCNDVYIKMEEDFASGNSIYTTDDLKGHLKFFGRRVDKWATPITVTAAQNSQRHLYCTI
jgi:hypothetical protein